MSAGFFFSPCRRGDTLSRPIPAFPSISDEVPMRRAVVVSFMIATLATVARADDQADAAALVEKGLKAVGGREKVARHKGTTWKETGTYYGMGAGLPYMGEYAMQHPDKFRMEIAGVFVIVINGKQGWTKMADMVTELTGERLEGQLQNQYAGWVSWLVPLSDKAYKLSTAGENKVGDRTTLGVTVKREGHSDVTLYFDKETGRLLKTDATVRSEEHQGKQVLQEVTYNEYREVDGVLLPFKIAVMRDGAKFVEAEMTEAKLHESLDENLFGKP
jgi:hypothetical protein